MAMAIPTLKMLRLTMMIFAGLAVLVAGEEMNTTSSASPKVQVSITTTTTPPPPPPTTTTTPAPQLGAVMDIFQAPLAAFKPKKHDKTEMTMGRDQQSSAATPVPSNIFFKAGSGLGSAASSLTGWFNNRMIPQALRPSSTTTPRPELMFEIVPNQQIKRRIVLASENGRKPLRNRQRPVIADDSEDLEDDEEQYNTNEDEEYDPNSNFSYDTKEDNDDDEEDDYQPLEKRKPSKKSQKQPNKQYYYIEEEIFDSDDDDLDSEVEVQMPKRKPPRKQQTQPNRRRKNPPQKKKQQKRRKPVRKVQNPQMVQVMQNRPSYQTQVKRKRRPSSSTFELVPISQNQAINSIQKKKPSSFTESNQQRPSSQFLNIPWSSLGFAGPPKDPASGDQQSKPIIVRIPQQNIKRKKRPTKKQTTNVVKNQRRKPLRGQLQNQSPVFSILSEDQVREIFKTQINEEQQMMPQTSHSPMILDNQKKPPKKESEEMSSNNNEGTEQQDNPQAGSEAASDNDEDSNNSFIVVGQADDEDDKEIDTNLYRHYSNYRGFKRIRAEPRYSHNEEEDLDYDYER
ncbi:probable WRKY transcription factor protein 1 [Eupeodes corollae]|uniref:probable WRKY transcription factor protein 1 n=1 Tax=Eupeodes corollae TaxID=290404 RepID=UPI002492453F|nr:probable WRKY transcription factor protein 1 [Eupeodes corollae]